MDDIVPDDPLSQYAPLGSVVIAIVIVVWTSVAFWLCHTPLGSNGDGAGTDSQSADGELADGVVGRVARDFADLLLEGKDKGTPLAQCDPRCLDRAHLDVSKMEELFSLTKSTATSGNGTAEPSKASTTAKKGNGSRGPLAKAVGTKDMAVGCDPRAAPSPARAGGGGDLEGRLGSARASSASSAGVGVGAGAGGAGVTGSAADDDGRGAGTQDLAAFREQLREKLALSLGCGSSTSLGGSATGSGRRPEELSSLVGPGRSRVDVMEAVGAKREVLEDYLKQLLLHPPLGGLRADEKQGANASGNGKSSTGARGSKLFEDADEKDGALGSNPRPGAAMQSMAEQAREIGNKYLQDRHFAAAAHCFEVACLLYPVSSGGSPEQLAAYHCNCQLACLELGRYGDAINEGSAVLSLSPPRHLAVKALYRLAVAHVNLKNAYEARRCLKRCLELDPANEYASAFLNRLGEEASSCSSSNREPCLTWVDPPKRAQNLSAVARAKGKKAKQKNGVAGPDEVDTTNGVGSASTVVTGSGALGGKDASAAPATGSQFRLDREAALWHTVARHNSKLYIMGGWPDSAGVGGFPGSYASQTAGSGAVPGASSACQSGHVACTGKGDGATSSPSGACGSEARGSDEFHVLDVDTFELRQLTGPSTKPPHACYGHTATMAGGNMVVFGGLGPPVGQPPVVMIFDVQQAKWRVPATTGVPPRQRQGHTANAVQGDRHLCIFGGIEPTGEQRVARVYSDANLLDLQSFVWRKLEVGGHRPPARFGHTATNLPGSLCKLLIIGGRDHLGATPDPALSGSFTGLHVLDTERRMWVHQPFSGTPPAQAFYHTATLLDDTTLLCLSSGAAAVAGDGGAAAVGAVPVHLLDLEAWRWSSPQAAGPGPLPRVGHEAALVGGRVYVFGGVVRRGNQAGVDKAVHILEAGTLRQEQREPPQASESSSAISQQHNSTNGKTAERNIPASSLKATADRSDRSGALLATRGDAKATSSAVALERPEKPQPQPQQQRLGISDQQQNGSLPGAPVTSAVGVSVSATPVGSSASASTSVASGSASSCATTAGSSGGGSPSHAVNNSTSNAASHTAKVELASSTTSTADSRGSPAIGSAIANAVSATSGASAAVVKVATPVQTPASAPPTPPEAGPTAPPVEKAVAPPTTTRASADAAAVVSSTGAAATSVEPRGTGASRDALIEMMLQDDAFGDDMDDEPELSFEELLEQEKKFFKAQSEKLSFQSFPRSNGKDVGGKKGHRP